MRTITLKNRIIVALATFTIVIICVFIAIQLSHEIGMVRKSYQSEATHVYLSVVDSWENIKPLERPLRDKVTLLYKRLEKLRNSKTIVNAYIFNKDGKIVLATDSAIEGGKADLKDRDTIRKAGADIDSSGEPVIDEAARMFSLYCPLRDKGRVDYVARIFFSWGNIQKAVGQVYKPAFTVGILIVVANVFLSLFLSRLVIGPIRIFNEVAKVIASGRLDSRVRVNTGDELEELGDTFNLMTTELAKMKERAENANPLTKLPGNIVIMEEVEKRIKQSLKFTVIYCDLDNFKAFNDKYGIHKGDDAITMTGDIFREAIRGHGGEDDFVGHEGGDDFLLLTTPERAKAVAKYIIAEFDKRVRSLYDEEDLSRGHIVAHARDGSVKQFPIMTISLAGVTNQHHEIKSYAEVTNIAALVKKKAKKEPRSCFVIEDEPPA